MKHLRFLSESQTCLRFRGKLTPAAHCDVSVALLPCTVREEVARRRGVEGTPTQRYPSRKWEDGHAAATHTRFYGSGFQAGCHTQADQPHGDLGKALDRHALIGFALFPVGHLRKERRRPIRHELLP